MKIILASASARRQELLKRLTENFEVIVSDFNEEDINYNGNCCEYVLTLAEGKAKAVERGLAYDALVIGCDTVVSLDNKVLEKPKDKIEAFNMLKALSGKTHQVYSGLVIIDTSTGNVKKEYVVTHVTFSHISDDEIKAYIETGEPMDKAGAYGIQGKGGVFVQKINGCFYNVVGLPLNKLKDMLNDN